MLDDRATLAYVDDYHYWKKYDEKAHAAKLTIVDENDYDTLQIFFDESINLYKTYVIWSLTNQFSIIIVLIDHWVIPED